MACDCRSRIEAKLTERFVLETPGATGHKVALKGYALCFGVEVATMRPYMEYETFAQVPLKKGGSKPKKTTGNFFFTYCPFCGTKGN